MAMVFVTDFQLSEKLRLEGEIFYHLDNKIKSSILIIYGGKYC